MITKVAPQLPSVDLERSQAFYTSKLGFFPKRKYNDLVVLEKDGFELHLCLSEESMPRKCRIYYYVDDIERLYDQCDMYGIVYLNADLEETPWGMKEFSVADPDNNLIKFGQISIAGYNTPKKAEY